MQFRPVSAWFPRSGWVCAVLLGLTLTAFAQDVATPAADAPVPADTPATKPLQIEADRPIVPFAITGSLRAVNAGRVSPFELLPVENARWIAALGAGTLDRDRNTGDMLMLAGRTFIRTTDPKTGVKLVEVTTPYKTPFAMAMMTPLNDGQVVFPRVYRLDNAEPGLLHTALENLAKDAGAPIGVIGWVEMPDVEGIAIKRAPIENEALTGSKKDQYLDTIQLKEKNVAFFAVVVPASLPRPSLNASLIGRLAMDFDPEQGKPAAALIHVHGALVDRPAPADYVSAPLIMDGLKQVKVEDILHLYGFSTIKRGMLMVYRIDYLAK